MFEVNESTGGVFNRTFLFSYFAGGAENLLMDLTNLRAAIHFFVQRLYTLFGSADYTRGAETLRQEFHRLQILPAWRKSCQCVW